MLCLCLQHVMNMCLMTKESQTSTAVLTVCPKFVGVGLSGHLQGSEEMLRICKFYFCLCSELLSFRFLTF